MAPFSHFQIIAYSLAVIAVCTVAVTLRTFGFWKWLAAKASDWSTRYAGRI
jgi:hypothetical protein